jgi:hypothetical protein
LDLLLLNNLLASLYRKNMAIYMRLSKKYGIALLMAIIIFIPNVCAIKVSVSNEDGISYSGDYKLDKSTSLQDNILLAGEGIFQERRASGSGINAIIQSIGGNDYNGKSLLITSGSFSSSSSSIATINTGTISQDISAYGDAAIGISANTANGAVNQEASVNNGAMKSSQSLAAGASAIAVQNTDLTGGDGTFDASARSSEGQVETVNGYYEGGGYLDAKMASISCQGTTIQGAASLNGLDLIDEEVLLGIESEGGAMSVEGLCYPQKGKLQSFGLSAMTLTSGLPKSKGKSTSMKEELIGTITNEGSNPELINKPPGDVNAYWFLGGMINPKLPIQLYLKSDSNLEGKNLDANSVAQSISSAAKTWDFWTKPNQNNLFKLGVIIDPSKGADIRDGYSTHAFIPVDSSLIAYARTWYDKNYKYIEETDVCYNTKYQWTTDWNLAQTSNLNIKDVQSIALHELGHACGLGDLYILPEGDLRKRDSFEIMNRYDGPQHNLGAGDINGILVKYGG